MNGKEKRARLIRIVFDAALSVVFIALLAWLKLAKDYDGIWIKVLFFAVIMTVSKFFYDIHLYNGSFGTKKKAA